MKESPPSTSPGFLGSEAPPERKLRTWRIWAEANPSQDHLTSEESDVKTDSSPVTRRVVCDTCSLPKAPTLA